MTVRGSASGAGVWSGGDTYAYGTFKLKARMRHAKVGFFDILEKHYHLCHKLAARSHIFFPTSPALESSQSPQDNQTLTMVISDVIQEVPDDDPSQSYFELTVTLSSGRTAPAYSLCYELELFR